MTKLSKLLVSLLLSTVILSGCQNMTVDDFRVDVTLPASEDCYGFNVISGKETRLAAEDPKCIEQKAKSVRLDYENWKRLRRNIEVNCQFEQCTQIKGAFDELFFRIDQGLQQIPMN